MNGWGWALLLMQIVDLGYMFGKWGGHETRTYGWVTFVSKGIIIALLLLALRVIHL